MRYPLRLMDQGDGHLGYSALCTLLEAGQ